MERTALTGLAAFCKLKSLDRSEANEAGADKLRGRALAIALLSAAALFMENLDSTIIATGLPAMARQFNVSPVALNVGITAYLVTLAVFIPISGWMANRFGERRVFAAAVLVFTVASACCGLSKTLPEFLAARVLQGFGGSMMVPVGRIMVVRAVSKAQLMRAIAYTIWPALTAPILGPVVGGYVIQVSSWPWMFLLNVPIGVVLFALALLLVQDSPDREAEPLDLIGFLLVGASSLLLVLGLERVQAAGRLWTATAAMLAGCALLATLAWAHLRSSKNPLFRLELFRIRTFRTVMGAGSLFRMAVFSVPFLLPLLFQVSFGLDALRSGSLVMAVFAGNLAMKPLTTPLLHRFGFRSVLVANGVLTALLLAACGWLRSETPLSVVLLILFLGGAGRSMELTSLTTLGFADLPKELAASGTALATMVQQLTVSVGIAIAALVLKGAPYIGSRLAGGLQPFQFAFCAMAVLALLSLWSFQRLPHGAGDAVSGRGRESART